MRKYKYYDYFKNLNDARSSAYQINQVNLNKLLHQLKIEITRIFPQIKFIFFTGYFAYDLVNIESDVDISVLVDHECLKKLSNEQLIKKRIQFAKVYDRLHNNYGIKINNDFPGEIASDNILKDVLNGRGFEVFKNNLELPPVRDASYWIKDYEVDYRVWMGMLAFNNNKLIYGNKKDFFDLRIEVFSVILKFIFLKLCLRDTNYLDLKESVLSHIISGGKQFLGIDEDFLPEFYYDVSILYDLAFDNVFKKRLIFCRNNSFYTNIPALEKWQNEIVKKKIDSQFSEKNIYAWIEYYYILKNK